MALEIGLNGPSNSTAVSGTHTAASAQQMSVRKGPRAQQVGVYLPPPSTAPSLPRWQNCCCCVLETMPFCVAQAGLELAVCWLQTSDSPDFQMGLSAPSIVDLHSQPMGDCQNWASDRGFARMDLVCKGMCFEIQCRGATSIDFLVATWPTMDGMAL